MTRRLVALTVLGLASCRPASSTPLLRVLFVDNSYAKPAPSAEIGSSDAEVVQRIAAGVLP